MWKKILIYFFLWRGVLYLLAYIAARVFPSSGVSILDSYLKADFPYPIWIWGNFDGNFYLNIAYRSYFANEQAFFPLLPILIRFLYLYLSISPIVGGQIISNLSLLFSFIVLARLLKLDKKAHLFSLFLPIVLLFPTAFFYVAIYNDSLFLLLASLSLYFVRKRRWILGSSFAALATLTRLNGLVLLPVILTEYFVSMGMASIAQQWKIKNWRLWLKKVFSWKVIRSTKIYTVLLVPAVFAAYLHYIQVNFGSWKALFWGMSVWGQERVIFPLQVLWRYFKIIFLYPTDKLNYWIAVLEMSSVVLYLFLLLYTYKKIRLSYWLFFFLSLLIPSLTGTFQGMPRYGLHLYPLFLGLALFLQKRSKLFRVAYFCLSALLLSLLLLLFTRGYFVA